MIVITWRLHHDHRSRREVIEASRGRAVLTYNEWQSWNHDSTSYVQDMYIINTCQHVTLGTYLLWVPSDGLNTWVKLQPWWHLCHNQCTPVYHNQTTNAAYTILTPVTLNIFIQMVSPALLLSRVTLQSLDMTYSTVTLCCLLILTAALSTGSNILLANELTNLCGTPTS